MMRTRIWALCAVMWAASACQEQRADPAPATFGPGRQVGGLGTGEQGASCVANGSSDCASGLCARVSGTTALCTHPCNSTTRCEVGWKCTSMGPSTSKFWCLRAAVDTQR